MTPMTKRILQWLGASRDVERLETRLEQALQENSQLRRDLSAVRIHNRSLEVVNAEYKAQAEGVIRTMAILILREPDKKLVLSPQDLRVSPIRAVHLVKEHNLADGTLEFSVAFKEPLDNYPENDTRH